MTKMEKLLNIFAKKPDTSIEDAMRRTGASRPLAYKARQQASVMRMAAACSEDPPKSRGDISRFTDERGFPSSSDQITSTLSERGEKYGPFIGHAEVSRALKNVLRFYTVERKGSWQTLDADMAEALEMIAHKMARIINGDQNHTDSWIDIAGYAKLVADRLQGVTR
jgi:hypothetical protein